MDNKLKIVIPKSQKTIEAELREEKRLKEDALTINDLYDEIQELKELIKESK